MTEIKINKIEKLKRSLAPYDYYKKRLGEIDPEEIGEADRFYLKNFGIYNHKLRPENFVLRIRVPGGRVSSQAFESIVKMAKSAESRIVVTSRAQLELHDLSFEVALRYSQEIERFGLSSWQTYTDNIRNIVTDPLDGLSPDSVIEVYGIIAAMERLFLKRADYVGMLPRKFNTAISGAVKSIAPFCGNDLFFALARKGGEYGFNVYAGGKSSDAATDLDIFCTVDEVAPFFEAVIKTYIEYGPRESRSRTRLFHMIKNIGLDGFKELLFKRYGKKPKSAGERLYPDGYAYEKDRLKLKDGTFAHRYKSGFGELSFAQADEIVQICKRYDLSSLRIGCDQNIYIPGLPEFVEFEASSDRYTGIVACAGSKYCVYSLFDTKSESAKLVLQKAAKNSISIGFSGCLKGCARHAFSDIGLVGIRTGLYDTKTERGIRLYLGAEYTKGERAGRLILYSVPLRSLENMLDLIVALFERSGFGRFEEFAASIINRYSREALAFWLLMNYYRKFVSKKGELFIPEARTHDDEKSYFAALLEGESGGGEFEIVSRLKAEEEFAFREAIIYLEKASFAVR